MKRPAILTIPFFENRYNHELGYLLCVILIGDSVGKFLETYKPRKTSNNRLTVGDLQLQPLTTVGFEPVAFTTIA